MPYSPAETKCGSDTPVIKIFHGVGVFSFKPEGWGNFGILEKKMETPIVYLGTVRIMKKKTEARIAWGSVQEAHNFRGKTVSCGLWRCFGWSKTAQHQGLPPLQFPCHVLERASRSMYLEDQCLASVQRSSGPWDLVRPFILTSYSRRLDLRRTFAFVPRR